MGRSSAPHCCRSPFHLTRMAWCHRRTSSMGLCGAADCCYMQPVPPTAQLALLFPSCIHIWGPGG